MRNRDGNNVMTNVCKHKLSYSLVKRFVDQEQIISLGGNNAAKQKLIYFTYISQEIYLVSHDITCFTSDEFQINDFGKGNCGRCLMDPMAVALLW